MTRWPFACAMFIAISTAVHAAPDASELFDLCPPDEGMNLVVENLPEHAPQAGLTEERIRNAAESRLRAAGIYDPQSGFLPLRQHQPRPPEKREQPFPVLFDRYAVPTDAARSSSGVVQICHYME